MSSFDHQHNALGRRYQPAGFRHGQSFRCSSGVSSLLSSIISATSRPIPEYVISRTQQAVPGSFEHKCVMSVGFESVGAEVSSSTQERDERYRFRTDILCSPRILDEDGVEALCVESCLSSLQSAKSIIETACTATTDFVVQEEVAYPGQYPSILSSYRQARC